MLDEYGMNRDDLFETLSELQLPGLGDALDRIESKTKSAFTRKYNQGVHRSQAIAAAAQGASGRKRKAIVAVDGDDLVGEHEDEAAAGDQDEQDDVDVRQFLAKKKKAKAPGASSKAKKAAGSSSSQTKPKRK